MNTAADHQRSEEERASTVRLFLGFRLATMQEWQQSELASRLGLAELAPPDSKDDLQLTSQQRYGWSSQLEKLRPALRVSEKWYRAKRLVERIFEGRSSVPERKIIDTEARHKYAKLRSDLRADYDQFAKEISAVSDEQSKLLGLIDAIRQASIDDGARISSHEVTDVTDSLQTLMEKRLDDLVAAEERIDAILDKAHLYIAASIILQRSGEGRKKCLSEYGLAVGDDSGPIPVDDVLLAVLAMVGVLFVFNFILYYVLSLTTDADNNPSATAL
jgi:hypothetical protein